MHNNDEKNTLHNNNDEKTSCTATTMTIDRLHNNKLHNNDEEKTKSHNNIYNNKFDNKMWVRLVKFFLLQRGGMLDSKLLKCSSFVLKGDSSHPIVKNYDLAKWLSYILLHFGVLARSLFSLNSLLLFALWPKYNLICSID